MSSSNFDSSTIKDLSGNSRNGTITGATWDRQNGTISLDGVDDYVNAGMTSYNFGNKISIALRIKFNLVVSSGEIDVISNYEGGGFGVKTTNGKLGFSFHSASANAYKEYSTTFTPNVGVWYNIVAVYDGAAMAVYLNGTKLTLDTSVSGSTSTASGNITASVSPLIIGGNPGGNLTSVGNLANITYDSVLVFNRGLTENEISSNYKNSMNPSNRSSLLLYYEF